MFESLQQIHAAIKSRERKCSQQTNIFKTISSTNYRQYKCAHHIGCKFTFYFRENSTKEGDAEDALPKIYSKKCNLQHCGKSNQNVQLTVEHGKRVL